QVFGSSGVQDRQRPPLPEHPNTRTPEHPPSASCSSVSSSYSSLLTSASETRNPRSRRVLLVEDNADARETLHDLLELAGYHVDVASDGTEGLAKAVTARPDVALIDIGLPGLNGYQVARAIRSTEQERSSASSA